VSTAAQRRLEAAEAAARRLDSAGSEPDGIAPPAKRHVRTDPVRCTADMPPARHAKWLSRLDEASSSWACSPAAAASPATPACSRSSSC
jgi:hypothetical protein